MMMYIDSQSDERDESECYWFSKSFTNESSSIMNDSITWSKTTSGC